MYDLLVYGGINSYFGPLVAYFVNKQRNNIHQYYIGTDRQTEQ